MMTKRTLGVLMLVLLACGPGGDTPTSSPAEQSSEAAQQDSEAAEKDLGVLRDHFVWSDASQAARDWDVDAEACKESADKDPSVPEGAHPLAKLVVFTKCMEQRGWAIKRENR